MHQSLSFIAWR